jgi:hypothetical protein
MAERKRAQTLENSGNAATALDVLDDHQVGGPLGKLNTGGEAGLPRNDLPWDTGGYEQSAEDRIAAILAEVGQGDAQGLVSIWKLNDQTKKLEFVDRRGTDDFEESGLPYLAKAFGAGEYELKIYGPDKRLHSRLRVNIAKVAAAVAANNPVAGNSDVSALVKVMADGFQQLGQLIAQSRPPVETRAQMLQELVQMKQVFGGESKGADPMAMFTQMLTLAKQLQPRDVSDGPGLFVDLADRFLPVVMEAVKGHQAAPGAAPPAIAAPNPNPQQPQRQQLTPEQEGAQKMSFQLRMQLGFLCMQAARDLDPAPYAALIVDQVSPDVLNQLVNDPNWLDALAKFHADVRKHPEWFEELRQLVIEEMRPDEDLPSGTEGAIQAETLEGGGDDVLGSGDHSE